MKLKNILLSGLSLVLVAALAIGGTVAYLQDDDSDVNVMTLGNVQIEQLEYQRAEGVGHINAGAKEGDLVPFVQGQTLYPAVPANNALTDYSAENGDVSRYFYWGEYAPGANGLWDDDKLANVMDKFVFVKNTGKSDAYYRTIFAFECPEGMKFGLTPDDGDESELMMNTNSYSAFTWDDLGYTVIDGTRYKLMVANYANILKPQETSRPSLLQVLLTHKATNEDMALLGDTYDILVVSQAVQAAGFADAETALNAGFGDITTTDHPWVDGVVMPTLVTSADELQAALDSAIGDAIITLADDITGNVVATQKEGVNITIDGNGYEYTGTIEIYGQARFTGAETLTIQNVNFVANEKMDFISCNTTESAKRYAHNVTIQNCSFTGNGTAEVMGVRFRQCYNITMKDCTANGMYGIIWATGGNGYVLDNVDATDCRNGISVGTSTPVTIKNCDLDVDEYGVRADNKVTMILENNKISAKQPVIVRNLKTAGLVLNLSGNTLTATGTDNYQVILTAGADDAAYVAPSVDYTVNGANGVVIFK